MTETTPENALASAIADAQGPPRDIDQALMRLLYPRQKAALTRAVKTGDLMTIVACAQQAIREWNEIGAWPDDWARWQAAINDRLLPRQAIDLRDLAP